MTASTRAEPLPITVGGLRKAYGNFTALHGVSFQAEPGKIVALLGPSGCGKTTTLRCIAGLEIPDHGRIVVGSEVVSASEQRIYLPPNKRNMGMVFQSYAIWPHMSVFENIAYPLRARRVGGEAIRRAVEETLEIVGLSGLAQRPSGHLSGGQQQRVALGRAIVARPRVLLFDEPLSNLDAKLRAKMRYEIVRLQRELGLTSVFVTHDQGEAMAIADTIIVMNAGKIEQIGDPRSIYSEPRTPFVADFIGSPNLLNCTMVEDGSASDHALARLAGLDTVLRTRPGPPLAPGASALAVLRPEALRPATDLDGPMINRITVTVEAVQYLGSQLEVYARLGAAELRAWLAPGFSVSPGQSISLAFAPEDCRLLAVSAATGGNGASR